METGDLVIYKNLPYLVNVEREKFIPISVNENNDIIFGDKEIKLNNDCRKVCLAEIKALALNEVTENDSLGTDEKPTRVTRQRKQ